MKTRYYLFRMGKLVQLDNLDINDTAQYQGYYCLDLGPDLNDARYGMMLGGRIKDLDSDKFPSAFKAQLLILGVP